MGLRERAYAALKEREMIEARECQKWFEMQKATAKAAFRELFGEDPETMSLGDRYTFVIEHDGMRFNFIRHFRELRLLRTCPRCGKEVASPNIRDLAHLAELLEDFSRFNHHCAGENESDLRSTLHVLADRLAEDIEKWQALAASRSRMERMLANCTQASISDQMKRVS